MAHPSDPLPPKTAFYTNSTSWVEHLQMQEFLKDYFKFKTTIPSMHEAWF